MIELNANEKQWVDGIFEKLDKKLSLTAVKLRGRIPYSSKNGVYPDMGDKDVRWWTNGFYGGLMWLMYKATGNEDYRKTAENHEKILDGALEKIEETNHDTGFMWGLTAKANYLISGNRPSKVRALYAATILAARVNVNGRFIRAWNGRAKTYSIIDCLMNLPMLYWASKELNDDRFKYIAVMHADMAMRDHVRENGSVVHICVHDDNEDKVVDTLHGQGYCKGSTWTRGAAWAIYGFMISQMYTGDNKYLETAKKVADYFIEEVKKENYKVLCDFDQPKEPLLYDNSAAGCAACGMIEIYKATGEKKYLDCAVKMLQAMEEDMDFELTTEAIVQRCCQAYEFLGHIDMVYGDFFLAEAILKLKNSDFFIW